MKRSSKELKRIARDILNNRYRVPMGAFVAVAIITTVIEMPFSLPFDRFPTAPQIAITLSAEFLILLVRQVLDAGIAIVHLNMTRGRQFGIGDILIPFRSRTEQFFLAALLLSLLFFVCCSPFAGCAVYSYFSGKAAKMLPILLLTGILSALLAVLLFLHYGFTMFFLADNPQKGAVDALRSSRLMMKKNKLRFFYVLLSFLGWGFLVLCSFGIAALWVKPYRNQTVASFYLDCTGELDRIPVRDYCSV